VQDADYHVAVVSSSTVVIVPKALPVEGQRYGKSSLTISGLSGQIQRAMILGCGPAQSYNVSLAGGSITVAAGSQFTADTGGMVLATFGN
jgi:hypothetical protein